MALEGTRPSSTCHSDARWLGLAARVAPRYPAFLASAEDIAGLVRKYEEIVRLRLLDRAPAPTDPRTAMAALAAEFPGALREADDLSMAELEHRLAELREATAYPERAPAWVAAMARFHSLARGALAAKRWLSGKKSIDPTVRRAFAAAAPSLPYGAEAFAWAPDLERLAAPPSGRVTEVVFARMSVELGVPASDLRRLVFQGKRSRG